MKNKSLKKNAALNMVKAIMGLIFPLITFPYASRILQPSGLGKVNFAHSIISYFSMNDEEKKADDMELPSDKNQADRILDKYSDVL